MKVIKKIVFHGFWNVSIWCRINDCFHFRRISTFTGIPSYIIAPSPPRKYTKSSLEASISASSLHYTSLIVIECFLLTWLSSIDPAFLAIILSVGNGVPWQTRYKHWSPGPYSNSNLCEKWFGMCSKVSDNNCIIAKVNSVKDNQVCCLEFCKEYTYTWLSHGKFQLTDFHLLVA